MKAKDIIKMLPIDENRKMQMLNSYDYLDKSGKLSIDQLAWDSYYAVYNGTLEANLQRQLARVRRGEEELGKDFYARALQKTEQDMQSFSQETVSKTDLAAARKAMEQIVQEIRAAKTDKKSIAS